MPGNPWIQGNQVSTPRRFADPDRLFGGYRLFGGLLGRLPVTGLASRRSDMRHVPSGHNKNRRRLARTGSTNSIKFVICPIAR